MRACTLPIFLTVACSGAAETSAETDSSSDANTETDATTSTTDSEPETDSGTDSGTETGSESDPETETGSDTDDPMPIDCAVDAWDLGAELEWKIQWMTTCMVPTIGPILQGVDPVLYEDFTCTHCHGDGLGGGSYAMPAATALDFSLSNTWNPDYFDSSDPMNSPMFEVMTTAAGLLGYEPYNQNNPDSFGCAGCHVTL